ncbi:hypothetical protein DV738_g963, partial [Chaetothyriales sp. CBS 135597]
MARSTQLLQSANGSYANLLNALKAGQDVDAPQKKKRKLNNPLSAKSNSLAAKRDIEASNADSGKIEEAATEEEEENEAGDAASTSDHSDDDNENSEDSFRQHFVTGDAEELNQFAKDTPPAKKGPAALLEGTVRRSWIQASKNSKEPHQAQQIKDLHLKQRLATKGSHLLRSLNTVQRDLAGAVSSYCDVLAGIRTVQNATVLRNICMLHALNHVYKTRDLVLKNNAKLSQSDGDGVGEIRDQGFTRPKVLVVVPTRQSCVRVVESIVDLSEPQQQENKARFLEQFSQDDDDDWHQKPEDFQELFGGNHGEDFRLGLKFTRKAIKFFSGFYNSDIIIASPLGLRRSIESGGKKEEEGAPKVQDSDFLSSIEIVMVDNASALQMQNWEHVEFVFQKLNLLPREAHGCDFSRVRHWYLDGHAKFLRQTIVLSAYQTPEINSLATEHLLNIAGRVQYTPVYEGALTEAPKRLPFTIQQSLMRFEAASAAADAEARLKMFTSLILPQLLRGGESLRGALIFAPTYLDFSSLRNHLTSALEKTAVSFGHISEYTPVKEVNRARSHFMNGRYGILLYSERAHHHFRYRLRGVRKIVFYGVPENPLFWTEIQNSPLSDCNLTLNLHFNLDTKPSYYPTNMSPSKYGCDGCLWIINHQSRAPGLGFSTSTPAAVRRTQWASVSPAEVCGECCPFFRFGIMHGGMMGYTFPELCRLWVEYTNQLATASEEAAAQALLAEIARGGFHPRSATILRFGAFAAPRLPIGVRREARRTLKGFFRRRVGTLVALHQFCAEAEKLALAALGHFDPMEGVVFTGPARVWDAATCAWKVAGEDEDEDVDVDAMEGACPEIEMVDVDDDVVVPIRSGKTLPGGFALPGTPMTFTPPSQAPRKEASSRVSSAPRMMSFGLATPPPTPAAPARAVVVVAPRCVPRPQHAAAPAPVMINMIRIPSSSQQQATRAAAITVESMAAAPAVKRRAGAQPSLAGAPSTPRSQPAAANPQRLAVPVLGTPMVRRRRPATLFFTRTVPPAPPAVAAPLPGTSVSAP